MLKNMLKSPKIRVQPMTTTKELLLQIDFLQKWYTNLTVFDKNLAHQSTVSAWLNHANPHQNLVNYKNLPLQFVPQNDLPNDIAYESFIATTGKIPTRDNFHDLLNGMIWLNFPKTKATFNQLHHRQIHEFGIGNARTALRNVLTLFDENGGVLVSSSSEILHALQQFDWQTAFLQHEWQNTQFFAIGHALLEKLINPRKNITAHCLLLQVDDDWFLQNLAKQRKYLDDFLANLFLQENLFSKMFQPLPVLGLPNYCQQDIDFYQDKTVFREKRAGEPAKIWHFSIT